MHLPSHLTRLIGGHIATRSLTNDTATTDGRISPLVQADGLDQDGFNIRNST